MGPRAGAARPAAVIALGGMPSVPGSMLPGRGVEASMAVNSRGGSGGLLRSGSIGPSLGAVVPVLGVTLFQARLEEEQEQPDAASPAGLS